MDRQQGSVPYFPPPPGQTSGRPPPLPSRPPVVSAPSSFASQPPPIPSRPGSDSIRSWSTSIARTVASNIKAVAQDTARSSLNSSILNQITDSFQQQFKPTSDYSYPSPYQPPHPSNYPNTSHANDHMSSQSWPYAVSPLATLNNVVGGNNWVSMGLPENMNPADQAHYQHAAVAASLLGTPQHSYAGDVTMPQGESLPDNKLQYHYSSPDKEPKGPYSPSDKYQGQYLGDPDALAGQSANRLSASISRKPLPPPAVTDDSYIQSDSIYEHHDSLPTALANRMIHESVFQPIPREYERLSETRVTVSDRTTYDNAFESSPNGPDHHDEQSTIIPDKMTLQPIPAQVPSYKLPDYNISTPHHVNPALDQSHQEPAVSRALEDVIYTLDSLRVSQSIVTQAGKSPDQGWIEETWARPSLSFTSNGEANPVIWNCPGAINETVYETSWYHMPDVPDFLICTRCHDRYIARTKLSGGFEITKRPTGRCRFDVPRITSMLLPKCQATGDMQPLKEYLTLRMVIKDCVGQQGTKGKDGFKWFIVDRETNDIMINFVACEACYQDIILADNSYAGEFIPRETRYADRPQPDDKIWMCDMSFAYVRRCFNVFSRNNVHFSDWVEKATKRFRLPKCEGKAVEASSCEWVRPKDRVEGLVICEECFFDWISWTAIENDFEYIPVAKPICNTERMDYIMGHRSEPASAWVCDVKTTAAQYALEGAVKRQDVGIFCRAAQTVLRSPPCTEKGISNGTWYTLLGGCEGFNICEGCFAGLYGAFDEARFFQKADTTGSAEPIVCNNHVSSARRYQFGNKLLEAGLEGDWSRYESTVRKYINMPVCAGEDHVGKRRWYGWHDCLICPECYEGVVLPTDGLVQQMEVHNEFIEEIRMCCMYSQRMRQKYVEACEKGDPAELLAFSRQRHSVYARTVPQIKMLRQMQEMQMMSAMSMGMAGLMYQGASSIQTISGSTDGYLHGNSSIGYHETENGATSAKLFSQMNSGAGGSGSWMQIFQLTLEWKEWE